MHNNNIYIRHFIIIHFIAVIDIFIRCLLLFVATLLCLNKLIILLSIQRRFGDDISISKNEARVISPKEIPVKFYLTFLPKN